MSMRSLWSTLNTGTVAGLRVCLRCGSTEFR